MSEPRSRPEIRVVPTGDAGAYIQYPYAKQAKVIETLDRHGVKYSTGAQLLSIDGEPPVAFIDLPPSEDASRVQALLDAA